MLEGQLALVIRNAALDTDGHQRVNLKWFQLTLSLVDLGLYSFSDNINEKFPTQMEV